MKSGKTTGQHAGMKTHSPSGCDKSMAPPSMKTTVNEEATRSSTAPNQKSLGPREA